MLTDAVATRLKDLEVIDRVEDALQLQALVESGQLPAAGVSAFVVPLGLRGGQVRSATAPFIQDTEETLAVVLALRALTALDARAKTSLTGLITAVIDVIAGWEPEGQPDTFRLGRAFLISIQKGVLLYQIEFSLSSSLRITP
ncbi:MAG: hypothetical protein Q7J44_14200 [Pseudotabrizicola sp.]|uniref:phage tail terminator protein n=1 Tax=Pseudotabrizicola sp. TaxID=2939647 RepID=UPI00271BC21D|nr:hypothetical protein [Pseudotabrizicola sp.]MDO9639688.1 hypothetical protein [Pseudotabrizicola sp.]